jgi:hypothetical protein
MAKKTKKKSQKNGKTTVIIVLLAIIVLLLFKLTEKQGNKTVVRESNTISDQNNNKDIFFKRDVEKLIHDNFESIIKEQPSMGGKWNIDTISIKDNIAYIKYEDGHYQKKCKIKINNPKDPKTWQIIDK